MKRIGPGPAKYGLPPLVGYTDHDYTRDRLPMYSFGIVTHTNRSSVGPGAGKYNLEYQSRVGVKQVPAYMGRATHLPDGSNVGPGPAKYMLPVLIGAERTRVWKDKSPDFVMGARLTGPTFQCGPGPAKYKLLDLVGSTNPKYSMAARLRQQEFGVSPGPAKYDPRMEDTHRLLITMKGRHPERLGGGTPGSNQYNLSGYRPGKRPPIYSMGMVLSGVAQPMIVPMDNC